MSDKRWQYKVETVKVSLWGSKVEKQDAQIQERLARLGLEGWELVAAVPLAIHKGSISNDNASSNPKGIV